MELHNCSFIGPITNAIANLTKLVYLDLSSNMFKGPMPLLPLSNNLVHIDLSQNNLSGPIPSNHFEGFHNLVSIYLGSNSFNESIPSSLFVLSSLQSIFLSNNKFDGLPAPPLFNASSSWLSDLDLSSNNLKGPFPTFLFKLKRLSSLSLSANLLNGTVKLQAFHAMDSLSTLDLSYNNLSVDVGNDNSSLPLLPNIVNLYLASCNLYSFPNIKNHNRLDYLDLSANRIREVPNWLWGNQYLNRLNLSHNLLVNLQEPYDVSYLIFLDLHVNQLSGKIPPVPQNAYYVDYSSNHFNYSLPIDIGYNLTDNYFFSASNNMLTGIIPDSICKPLSLQVLDLSNNDLSGRIPTCLMEMRELKVLNLANNNIRGNIPEISPGECNLQTLDLHGNLLEGEVPESLARCSMLQVLNLGKNLINDTFPCFLKKCANLQVLTLRSNILHGGILCIGATGVWPKLQIIDLASNYFTGHVPRTFLNWRAMITEEYGEQLKGGHLQVHFQYAFNYVDTVTVVNKGSEMELVKILTIFTCIDFSNNRFSGEIPSSIGELKALYLLNMSHNAFTGSIPASFGNLRQLGSLDLSVNNLAGMIPTELTSLTFLAFLNLSCNCNQLEGRIPQSSQLQTFTETSFGGNKDLCGFQLNKSCITDQPPPPSEESDEKGESNVELVGVEVGFIVVLATFVVPLLFNNRWSRWYYKHVEQTVVSKVFWYFERRNRERRNPILRLE